MLRPRIIPCLLIRNKALVKTVRFTDAKYVGDPINAVRIFNEKEVDELIVVDIDATKDGREPDYRLIEQIASECNMPLCYGGGVKSTDQIQRIVGLGVEKVAISSAAIEHPALITESAARVGSQSIVVVLDVKQDAMRGNYEVCLHSGKTNTGRSPVDLARQSEAAGAGEIVINSIDRDGTMSGYDIPLIRAVREAIGIPMTCLGGAGALTDIQALIDAFGTIGAAAGSLFVFKGTYRAVLIGYPTRLAKGKLVGIEA